MPRTMLLAAAILIAALLTAAAPERASAHCTAYADPPQLHDGLVRGWGYVFCGHNGFSAGGDLLRNGIGADWDGCSRIGAGRCYVTPVAPNRAGNQTWCLKVSGGDQEQGWDVARACESRDW